MDSAQLRSEIEYLENQASCIGHQLVCLFLVSPFCESKCTESAIIYQLETESMTPSAGFSAKACRNQNISLPQRKWGEDRILGL